MMFYLFVTFQILYSVSSDISCYKAPFNINSFNYIVTADHFPAELQNSSLEVNSVNCYIQVLWQRDPDNTQIALIADTNMKAISTQHQLQVDVGYETKMSPIPRWAKQIIYQCNSLNQLKHLLRALIVNESLHELAYLLNPVKPFHGEWCYRGLNATFENCNTTIPVSLCTDNSLLLYEKTFDITDRTNSSTWAIFCGRENCNTPAVGDSIRRKSYIGFDFTKFLNNETTV